MNDCLFLLSNNSCACIRQDINSQFSYIPESCPSSKKYLYITPSSFFQNICQSKVSCNFRNDFLWISNFDFLPVLFFLMCVVLISTGRSGICAFYAEDLQRNGLTSCVILRNKYYHLRNGKSVIISVCIILRNRKSA